MLSFNYQKCLFSSLNFSSRLIFVLHPCDDPRWCTTSVPSHQLLISVHGFLFLFSVDQHTWYPIVQKNSQTAVSCLSDPIALISLQSPFLLIGHWRDEGRKWAYSKSSGMQIDVSISSSEMKSRMRLNYKVVGWVWGSQEPLGRNWVTIRTTFFCRENNWCIYTCFLLMRELKSSYPVQMNSWA